MKRIRNNPYAIKLLEVFEDKHYVYIIMEFASNGDLLKKFQKNF